jgi:RNA polymerase-interacting CarD/CdnL/TRCF family regulator
MTEDRIVRLMRDTISKGRTSPGRPKKGLTGYQPTRKKERKKERKKYKKICLSHITFNIYPPARRSCHCRLNKIVQHKKVQFVYSILLLDFSIV